MRPALAGLAAAVITALLTLALPSALRLPLLAGLLWLTVGIYVGMALMDEGRAVRMELVGGIPALALTLLSANWAWLLPLAWLLHPAWDLLHEPGPIATKIHPMTVPFCIVYDVLVAGLAAWVVWGA